MDTHIMHSLLVMMKSTKLQYLELQGIPSDASMFTLIVNGVQKKPVKGGSNGDSLSPYTASHPPDKCRDYRAQVAKVVLLQLHWRIWP